MTEYVVIHAQRIDHNDTFDHALLVLKDRPAWQRGRLNLVGGKVEPGETPLQAAVRELNEESGLTPLPGWRQLVCGQIQGNSCLIHCVRLAVDSLAEINPRPGETEKVEWYPFRSAFTDPRLMPNLLATIPLMHLGVTGWKIVDQSWSPDHHEISVSFPLAAPPHDG